MRAAEKLRALDEAMTPGPWRYEDERSLTKWPGLHSETGTVLSIGHDYYKPDPRSLAALRNALPQIVAVVEAAERFRSTSCVHRGGDPPCKFCQNRAALAALDAVLTADGKAGDGELRDEGIHDAFDANQWD